MKEKYRKYIFSEDYPEIFFAEMFGAIIVALIWVIYDWYQYRIISSSAFFLLVLLSFFSLMYYTINKKKHIKK